MYLGDLIDYLRKEDPSLVVPHGFDGADFHSDRGSYDNLAFVPKENVSIGSMLEGARNAIGKTIYGYKGGEFLVTKYTEVLIGEDSSVCGEEITPLLLRYMVDAARANKPGAPTP